MVRRFLTLSLTICAALGLPMGPAAAQQTGGILKFFHRDSPASMSIHEEATISTVAPMMGVFNNLVLFKQDEKQNRPKFIEPELAESWSWDEDHTRLTFTIGRPRICRETTARDAAEARVAGFSDCRMCAPATQCSSRQSPTPT